MSENVIIDKNKQKHCCYFLMFNFGSSHEKAKHNGIAHFLEHMLFTAHKKYSRIKFNELIEKNGSRINAFTTREFTAYYVEGLPKYINESLKLLNECFIHKEFRSKDMEIERKIILNEIKQSDDNNKRFVIKNFYKELFKGSKFSMPIIGYENTIKNIKIQDLKNYANKFYNKNNFLVVSVGDINEDFILEQVSFLYDNLPKGKKPKKERLPRKENTGTIFIHKNKLEQHYFCKGFFLDNLTKETIVMLKVLDNLLSNGISSLLKKEIREKRGLAYEITSYFDYSVGYNCFYVYASFKKDKEKLVNKLTDKILLEKLRKKITKKEFDIAKRKALAELAFMLSNPLEKAEVLADCYLFGFESIDSFIHNIDSLTYNDFLSFVKDSLPYDSLLAVFLTEK